MSEPDRDTALFGLLGALAARNYRFITPTPLTHARVLSRADRGTARSLADIFGWSLAFDTAIAGDEILSLMRMADVSRAEGALQRSTIRVSTLDGRLFAHSAYPTLAGDAVFFGPDTYRFARFVAAHLDTLPRTPLRCVDIGSGSGAGAIATAARLPGSQWLLADINPAALRLAAINARHAGIALEAVESDVLAATQGGFDLVISNPPYLADPQQRAYRHGGGGMGRELSLRIVREACQRLNPQGRLLLYTGVAIVDGEDLFLADLHRFLDDEPVRWQYAELDPDVFGEELETPAYAAADRIAAIGLVVDRI